MKGVKLNNDLKSNSKWFLSFDTAKSRNFYVWLQLSGNSFVGTFAEETFHPLSSVLENFVFKAVTIDRALKAFINFAKRVFMWFSSRYRSWWKVDRLHPNYRWCHVDGSKLNCQLCIKVYVFFLLRKNFFQFAFSSHLVVQPKRISFDEILSSLASKFTASQVYQAKRENK